jgi:hypothetical protein
MLCVMQTLVISSKKVGWKKQGTCTLRDDEPASPEDPDLASTRGWKEVSNFAAVQGGGDFLFPMDQILLVTAEGYKPIKDDSKRVLSALRKEKNYLVWYHHVMTPKTMGDKFRELPVKERPGKKQKK